MSLDGESRPVIVAASGGLGYAIVKHVACSHWVEGIMTDHVSKDISEFAEKNGIPLFKGNPRNGKAQAFLSNLQRKVLLSVNNLFLFDEDFLQEIEIAINVHGSLLPKYRGRTPHVWAIINNERECGITAHRISAACDAGNILVQKKIRILKTDTGGSILKKYEKIYPVASRCGVFAKTDVQNLISRNIPRADISMSIFQIKSARWQWGCFRLSARY